jgi:phospholipid/cholesterol/gamma-HCH transport system substrate-binding protein
MAFLRRSQKRPDPGVKEFNEGIYHRPPVGLSFFKTGVLALILILVLSYFAYTKKLPWGGDQYTVTATFNDATTLRPTAPVRIAGVNVGKVTDIQPEGTGAKVTFTVDDEGLPIHDDATITIRPRLFLEGNFFLDLRPGSPSAADLGDGGSIPVTQTATAVQLDQLLTSLQHPDRENLARLLDGYGSALDDKPTAAQDVGQDPDVQGLSGAEAINRSFTYGGRAGKGTSQVNEALLGEQAGDLRGLISSAGTVFDKLASSESELSDLVTNFSITTGAFADESVALQNTLSELAPTVEQAQGQLVEIDKTFPPLRTFARALTPGVKELPATIRAGTPWLEQTHLLLQQDELGGLANTLRLATPDLAAGTYNLNGLFDQLGLLSRCTSNVLVPTGDEVITDQFQTGSSNFKEFLYGLAAQAGEGANFDGNGQFLRVQPAGGDLQVETPVPGGLNFPPSPDNVLYGNTVAAPIGTQPLKPKKPTPVNIDAPCYQQSIPSLNGPQGGVGAPNPAVDGGTNAVAAP